VRAIKNRFGAVNEIGVFAMTEKGLKGVSNPSAIFLSQHAEPVPWQLCHGDAGRHTAIVGRNSGSG
jgi:predicted ATP-dependent serine protease